MKSHERGGNCPVGGPMAECVKVERETDRQTERNTW